MDKLYAQLKGEYDCIYRNLPLHAKKHQQAEIDLLAIKNDRVDVFEVKCSYRICKAKKQLLRIRRLLGDEINMFFYCGSSRQLTAIVAP